MEYRYYQNAAIDAIISDANSAKPSNGIVVLPTGSGKSYIATGVAERYTLGPVIVLQPSKELLEQNYEKYSLTGAIASIYSASFGKKELGKVTFATLGSIVKASKELSSVKNILILCDEAHYKYPPERGSQFRNFIDIVKPKHIYGMTATPFRMHNSLSGSSLKMLNRSKPRVFNKIIYVQQISEIIDLGFWSESKDERWTYDKTLLDLNSTGSDYKEESIVKANQENSINRNIAIRVHELIKEGKRKSILIFVDSVENAATFADYFKKYTTAEYLHGGTSKKERDRIVKSFKDGSTLVVFNHSVLTTGFDHPSLDAIFMGRPTNSLASLYQIYGRGVRVSKGKEDFLFVDCCDNFGSLCHPRDISIEEHPVVGWSVFAGDKLVTGVPLLGATVSRCDLVSNQDAVLQNIAAEIMPFGKWRGRRILDMCKSDRGYAEYMAANLDTSQYGPRLKNIISEGIRQITLKELAL